MCGRKEWNGDMGVVEGERKKERGLLDRSASAFIVVDRCEVLKEGG